MRKFAALLIFFLLTQIFLSLHAQQTTFKGNPPKPPVTLDTALMEFIYVHISDDKVINTRETNYEMLTIGNNYMHYGGYGDFLLDSIARTDSGWSKIKTFEEERQLLQELELIHDEMTTNLSDSTITYYGHIFINYYRYSEPIIDFKWQLHNETQEVMGYECLKATTNWRGREWTAWYSEIPVSAGPWKFSGLPGLILKLEDSDSCHQFIAIGSKSDVFPFGYHKRLHSKTSREKYNEAIKDYKLNAGKVFAESGMVTMTDEEKERMKNRRLFFNPIELD